MEFDKYVPAQEYYGYKSLVVDNLTQDASILRERLSFLVFEAMGIAAPRNAFARLTVNGEYWGLFALVEPVSKPFLEARLGEKSGTLFDYEWIFPYDFSWRGGEPAGYVPLPFQPETNEEKPDVATGLVAFVQAINDTPDASFVSAMGSRLDVDRFLTHVAVENAIAEEDGVVGDQGLNNFYLYEYGAEEPLRVHPLGQGQHVPRRRLAPLPQPRDERPHPPAHRRPREAAGLRRRGRPRRDRATSIPAGSPRSSRPPTSRSDSRCRPTSASPSPTRSSRPRWTGCGA